MFFLKITRSVRGFSKRFGWLIAELLFIFLGMYGAFLLERMHDEELDLLRKRQILHALIDEFKNYEEELSSASHSLDEGYGVPFFTAYSNGEKPFPRPIPFGGMGKVNTGIWEAMLQSGGIEVLEVEMIQKVQVFFKKLQDLLDLYSRFERLTENMILPEMDRSVAFFYQEKGSDLRDKYKWYVNSLFTVGMSLRELSVQASQTKGLLEQEFSQIEQKSKQENKVNSDAPNFLSSQSSSDIDDQCSSSELQVALKEGRDRDGNISHLMDQALEVLSVLNESLKVASTTFDEEFAVPFFTSYSEQAKPKPKPVKLKLLKEPLLERILLTQERLKKEISSENKILVFFDKCLDVNQIFNEFHNRTLSECSHNLENLYYEENSTVLRSEFEWYPSQMFSIGSELHVLCDQGVQIFNP